MAAGVALQIALVALASYACGSYVTGLFHGPFARLGGLWSLISGIVVLQATRGTTVSSAWLRVLGTLIGSIVAAAYLSVLSFSAVGMAACIFGTVFLCHATRIPDHARLAALVVGVVMVSSTDPGSSPLVTAALRFIESCIGTAIAVLAVLMTPETVGRQT
jgi:uncharacterized membrane protein YccC